MIRYQFHFILSILLHTCLIDTSTSTKKINWNLLNMTEWWGCDDIETDERIRPARIEFSDKTIEDLKQRLNNHMRLTPPLKDAAFTYGFNTDALPYWVSYWAKSYPFKEREQYLNQYPQFKVNVQGLDIHFIWLKPEDKTDKYPIPLLMLHGWPGSIREFYEAIPLLTKADDARDFVLELIIPFIPGFGLSDAAIKPGLGSAKMAIVFRNFMHRIGFEKFYLQAGDWGAKIGSHMVTMFPDEILGFHNNYAIIPTLPAIGMQLVGSLNPSIIVSEELSDRMYPLSKILSLLIEESGYYHLQATKPDTVGIALTDSPTGLLAYLFEKFSTGVNPDNRMLSDGGLKNSFTPEQLLDNLMIYWSSSCITTSMRIYAETYAKEERSLGLNEIPTPVPTWVIQAKYEITYQPPMILKQKYLNLLNTTVLEFGGHFFAMEQPKAFAESVLTAIQGFIEWRLLNEL